MILLNHREVLLEKTNLEFESQAVLNPTCIEKNGTIHMFYRAVRPGNFSTIGYCQIYKNKVISRYNKPVIFPEHDYERHGVEDPRIVELEGQYFLFYTAYDGKNARTALATSTDLVKFTKRGLVTPSVTYEQARILFKSSDLPERYNWYALHYEEAVAPDVLLWEKDLVLFPEKFNGKFLLFHRVMPGVQYIYLDSLEQLQSEAFWTEQLKELHNHVVMNPAFWYETRKIAVSSTPIKTPHGWLQIYHGVEDTARGNIYRASAALLDLNNPTRVIGRLSEPLISPEMDWEKSGVESNVIFPSGSIMHGDELYIYYGAADSRIGVASLSTEKLINKLTDNSKL